MRVKVAVAIILLLSMLILGTATPPPAYASDAETAAIAGIATGIYVALVMVGAKLASGDLPGTLPSLEVPGRDTQDAVHFGARCTQAADRLTLLCW
jgi:hypothetical protein